MVAARPLPQEMAPVSTLRNRTNLISNATGQNPFHIHKKAINRLK
jgi:hypothetical protein